MEIRVNSNYVKLTGNDIRYIKFRNFDGHPDKFNPKGCLGNFTVVLTEDKAADIERRFSGREEFAIKVRWKENRDGDLEPCIKVNINWDGPEDRRPVVGQMTQTSQRVVYLGPDNISCLNSAEIVDCELLLNASKGNGCYVKQGLFVINETDLFARFRVPEVAEATEDEVY